MPPLGRLGDISQTSACYHGCVGCPHPAKGPAVEGSPNVNVNGKAVVRVGDSGTAVPCCGPGMWWAQGGSTSVFINGKGAHRQGDIVRHCGGIGQLVMGSSNVNVGG